MRDFVICQYLAVSGNGVFVEMLTTCPFSTNPRKFDTELGTANICLLIKSNWMSGVRLFAR